jgi:hypothetical protein
MEYRNWLAEKAIYALALKSHWRHCDVDVSRHTCGTPRVCRLANAACFGELSFGPRRNGHCAVGSSALFRREQNV